MYAVKIQSDAVQPPNEMELVVVIVLPILVKLRLAGPLCSGAIWPNTFLLLAFVPSHYAVIMDQLFAARRSFLWWTRTCANCAFMIFDNVKKKEKTVN